jgi:hypothetical protein
MVGWFGLVSWLPGWFGLFSWLPGWLDGWLVSWLVSWLVGWYGWYGWLVGLLTFCVVCTCMPGQKRAHLGRQRHAPVPGPARPAPPPRKRPWTSVRIPVATFRRQVCRHAHRLPQPGCRPAQPALAQHQNGPVQPPPSPDGMEPRGPAPDGAAALPHVCTVLRFQQRTVLPHVPTLGRHGSGRAVQHCQLRTAHAADCPLLQP